MLQHVGITPIVKERDVIQALRDLHFHPISQRFGCFFLHDLDLTTGKLPGIEKEDSATLQAVLNVEKATPTDPKKTTNPAGGQPGRQVSWSQLCHNLNLARYSLVTKKPFKWNSSWLIYSIAEEIFCTFTSQWWMALATSGFGEVKRAPTSLEEAMGLWTVDSVNSRINFSFNYELVPSADTLSGNIPQINRQYIFERLRERFFPEQVTDVVSPQWSVFFRCGYIKDYYEAIEAFGDGGKALREALDGIFTKIQILPYNPGYPSTGASLWRWKGKVVTLLFNSLYVEMLEKTIKPAEVEVRGKGHKKMLTGAQLERKVCGNEIVVREPKKSMAHRRGKQKNWRQPPPPRRRKGEEHVDGFHEGGEDSGQEDEEDGGQVTDEEEGEDTGLEDEDEGEDTGLEDEDEGEQ